MPFTPSHIVAILPLTRTPLFPAALAIGAMAPDLTYYVPTGIPRSLTHSLIGIPTADLAIGLAAFFVWQLLLRAPVLDFSPSWLRDRMPQRHPLAWRPPQWRWLAIVLVLLASLLIGIVTHVVWDSFTHPDGQVVVRVPLLREYLGPLQAYKWGQHIGTVGGLIVLAIWAVDWARRTPNLGRVSRITEPLRLAAWLTALGGGAFTAIGVWIGGLAGGSLPFEPSLVFNVARFGVAVGGLISLAWCVVWYLLGMRRSAT
jgi:Domain of unknown function (DUF4184)